MTSGGTAGARRGRLVLAVLVAGLALAASTRPAWVHARGTSALTGEVALAVKGATAAPAVTAAALVVLAAALALPLAARWSRWLVVAVLAGAGLLASVAAAAVLADPDPVARAAIAAGTGVAGLTQPAATTAWPWVAVMLGVALVGLAVAVARASSAWSPRARRYERASVATAAPVATADEPDDDRAAWDALTRGEDPTTGDTTGEWTRIKGPEGDPPSGDARTAT